MKLDRIIWGVLLLFVGGVLLLDNFDVIDFHWWNVWSFFPIFIIILGVNILFNRNNSQTGNVISLVILVIALGFLFVKGQQDPDKKFWWSKGSMHFRDRDRDEDNDNYDNDTYTNVHFAEPLLAGDANKETILNIAGGGTTFEIKGATDSLFAADVRERSGNFALTKIGSDSVNTLTFKMKDKHKRNWGSDNNVGLYLNTSPIWKMNVDMGAGEVNFDLSTYKVRTFNFNGGVAALEVRIGSLLPITDVNVKTGLTDVKIEIPEGSGCRIKAKTGLSSRDFDGFIKLNDGTYETPNYKTSTNKIFINFDGGLTSFEVNKY